MRKVRLIVCSLLLVGIARARADPLLDRMVEQITAGAPIVVQVHVALCDNSVIPCGGHGLGDGDSPRTNLYWGSSEGLRGWLGEQSTGWKLVRESRQADSADRLLTSIWHRRVAPGGALREAGVSRAFDAYLVIDAWRGTKIDAAVEGFVTDLFGEQERTYAIDGGALRAGGAATVVAWVGHNRFMDYASYPWRKVLELRSATKGVVAIACYSRPYLKAAILHGGHVPIVLTNDFVMAAGAPLVGALNALLDGGDLTAQRRAATADYARAELKDPQRLRKVFVNASSPRF